MKRTYSNTSTRLILLFALLLTVGFSSCQQNKAKTAMATIEPGTWRVALQHADGKEIPFIMEAEERNDREHGQADLDVPVVLTATDVRRRLAVHAPAADGHRDDTGQEDQQRGERRERGQLADQAAGVEHPGSEPEPGQWTGGDGVVGAQRGLVARLQRQLLAQCFQRRALGDFRVGEGADMHLIKTGGRLVVGGNITSSNKSAVNNVSTAIVTWLRPAPSSATVSSPR